MLLEIKELRRIGVDVGAKIKIIETDRIYKLATYQKEDYDFGFFVDRNSYVIDECWLHYHKDKWILVEAAPNNSSCNGSKHLSHKELYPHTCEYCGHDSYNGGMNNVDCSNTGCITKKL